MDFFAKEIKDCLDALDCTPAGLSNAQAKERLQTYGANEIKKANKRTTIAILLDQFKDVMIIILIIAAIVSAFLGEGVDAIVILALVAFNAVLGTVQEKKAQQSLDALEKLSAPNAKVLREGDQTVVPAKELVIGDIVLLDAGDYVPADLRLLEVASLKINESALTGEAESVEKHSQVLDANSALGDRKNMAFSSSLVTYGRGKGVVVHTAMDTEVGKIATMIQDAPQTMTPLQKRLAGLGKVLGYVALGICAVMLGVGLLYGRDPLEMFMTAVSLAVAAIPEGLPAISTVVLALGVQRMAKRNAIVRTLPSVETLGSATVICSDKTGTLTQNRMTVLQYALARDAQGIDAAQLKDENFIRAMMLNTDAKLTPTGAIGDPTETALVELAHKLGFDKQTVEQSYKRVSELPFDSERKLMSTVFEHEGRLTVYTKGGLDEVLARCAGVSDADKKKYNDLNISLATKALRVLAFAQKRIDSVPSDLTTLESDLTFLGVVGMIDPPREEAKAAVDICHQAGIQPVMITGDHAITASAIASELGILEEGARVVTGVELEAMSDQALFDCVKQVSVYARVSPEHKVRIVNAWQKHGEIVAMTGDGVNDAPALKTSDIGCSMGQGGTDVAKDASDLILVDDNFATIVSAIEEGRRIYDNILKSIGFLLGGNIAEVIVIFLAVVFNWVTPLVPIHILLVNLITDGLPALAMGVDPSEPGIMQRKARKEKGIFSKDMIFRMIYQGILISILTLIAYFVGLKQGVVYAQTMSFVVLAISQVVHGFNFHSNDKSVFKANPFVNKYLVLAALGSILIVFACIYVPGLNDILNLHTLPLGDFVLVSILSVMPLVVVEIMKALKLNTWGRTTD